MVNDHIIHLHRAFSDTDIVITYDDSLVNNTEPCNDIVAVNLGLVREQKYKQKSIYNRV